MKSHGNYENSYSLHNVDNFYKSLDIFPYLDPETLIHLWLFYKKITTRKSQKKENSWNAPFWKIIGVMLKCLFDFLFLLFKITKLQLHRISKGFKLWIKIIIRPNQQGGQAVRSLKQSQHRSTIQRKKIGVPLSYG